MKNILLVMMMLGIWLLSAGQDPPDVKALPLHPPCRPDGTGFDLSLKALSDADPAKRLSAVEKVYAVCDDRAIDALIEAIADPDWRVRAAVGRALWSFQIPRASNAALNVLVNPTDRKVEEPDDMRARCLTILAINQLRDVRYSRKAIGFLFNFLDFKDPAMHAIAEAAAAQLKNTRNGFHELAGIVKQHNFPDFRRKAAKLLGDFPEATEVLTDVAANDRDESVRLAAEKALEGGTKINRRER